MKTAASLVELYGRFVSGGPMSAVDSSGARMIKTGFRTEGPTNPSAC